MNNRFVFVFSLKIGMPTLHLRQFGLLVAVVGVAFLSSCGPLRTQTLFRDPVHEAYFREHKTPNYSLIKFKADSAQQQQDRVPYRYNILPGDQITIRFLNMPPELIGNPATQPSTLQGGGGRQGNRMMNQMNRGGGDFQRQYRVDVEGYITTYLLGRVKVAGKTVFQVNDELAQRFSEYYKNPILEVFVSSLRVFVFSELGGSNVISLNNQRTHLVEVLAQAGVLSQASKVNKVKIIRGNLGDPQVLWVNMRNADALGFPELIVQDQDIIFVEVRDIRYFLQEVRPYIAIANLVTVIPTFYLFFISL